METRHARMGEYESIAAGLWRRGSLRSGRSRALCKASTRALLTVLQFPSLPISSGLIYKANEAMSC